MATVAKAGCMLVSWVPVGLKDIQEDLKDASGDLRWSQGGSRGILGRCRGFHGHFRGFNGDPGVLQGVSLTLLEVPGGFITYTYIPTSTYIPTYLEVL